MDPCFFLKYRYLLRLMGNPLTICLKKELMIRAPESTNLNRSKFTAKTCANFFIACFTECEQYNCCSTSLNGLNSSIEYKTVIDLLAHIVHQNMTTEYW